MTQRPARGRNAASAAFALDGADAALDSLASARDIFQDLGTAATEPLAYLIRGRSETGKTTLLSAIEHKLATRGIAICHEPASAPESNGARRALVVDDAHLLQPHQLELLRTAAAQGKEPVIVATQPRPHNRGLRTLVETMRGRGRTFELRALGPGDMAPFARELGMLVPEPMTAYIHRQTGGIRGPVVTMLRAACEAKDRGTSTAVDTALHHWVRRQLDALSPALLDTLVVAVTGAGFDTDELAAITGVDSATAQELIDQARASALITDADLLLTAAVAPLRALLGEPRYNAMQHRLLTTKLDTGLLGTHTAVLLAESGIRDPRLADFLCTAAERADRTAARYYAAAVSSGADRDSIADRWAAAMTRTEEPIETQAANPFGSTNLQTLPRTERTAGPPNRLSDREYEVAELILLELTYREIGARLYISAKTVEHHVARIRRRIGAGSRSELLSMLRAMGHGSQLV